MRSSGVLFVFPFSALVLVKFGRARGSFFKGHYSYDARRILVTVLTSSPMNTSMAPATLAMSGENSSNVNSAGNLIQPGNPIQEGGLIPSQGNHAGRRCRRGHTCVHVRAYVWHMLTCLVNVCVSAVWLRRGAAGFYAR